MSTKLARRLMDLRLAQNLTQEQLAEKASVTQQYIGLLERGERTPSLGMLQRLAKAFGVKITYLLE